MIPPNPQEYLIIYAKWNRLSKKNPKTIKRKREKDGIREREKGANKRERGVEGRQYDKKWKRERGSGTESLITN